jgi:Conjugative transposon protein TcpC
VDRTQEDVSASPEPETTQTQAWSGGPVLATRIVTVGLGLALFTGPAALVLVALDSGRQAVPAAGPATVDLGIPAAAGECATEMATTWLSATRADSAGLEAIYSGDLPALPDRGIAHRDVRVAGLVDRGGGLWSVTVGVDLDETPAPAPDTSSGGLGETPVPDASAGGPGVEPVPVVWVRRYFVVPAVVGDGTTCRALSLPSPVPAPLPGDQPRLAASQTLTTTGALGKTVTAFLAALTTGEGQMDRYTSPGVDLVPIAPPAYAGVNLRELAATEDVSETVAPADGAQVHVRAVVELVLADGQSTTANYELDLQARAGRWEVTALASPPALKPAT